MRINLILEEDEEKKIFRIYLAEELLAICYNHKEVEMFLEKFEREHPKDSIILRFS